MTSLLKQTEHQAMSGLRGTSRNVLSTVGEAAHFIRANFSLQRSRDVDWLHTAKSLQVAAETNDEANRTHATRAIIGLLMTERLLDE
jgi:hypothetical protein